MANFSSTVYALEMIKINKTFGPVIALADVSLKVKVGTIHGLIGQNGAGKSTLMKILSGIYPHGSFEGEIKVAGESVKMSSPLDAQLRGISIVPQEITVADTLTVAENILLSELAMNRKGIYSKKKGSQKIEEFLVGNEIPLYADQLVSELSLHKKQILMIASALYKDPKVLVLDEPTSSLTSDEIENLFSIVRNLKKRGFTTVFITHKLPEILELCDAVSILRDGITVRTSERSEFDANQLVSDMIGRKLGELYPQRTVLPADVKVIFSARDLVVENPRKPGEKMVSAFSFDLHAGEILGLGGLVGSGRTEILRALYGDYRVLAGKLELKGKEITSKNIPSAINSGIGYVTEDRKLEGLFFNLEIRSNSTASILDKFTKFGLLNKRKEKIVAKEITESLAVKPQDIFEMIANLSGGNQQKVLIGKGLLAKPVIFMLDEPTKGVDIASKAEIYRIVSDLAKQGVGIILVSSEFPELLALSHRILVFSGGAMIGEMTGDSTKEQELMMMAISQS
jgi:ABC-type sugar transport system ATPase subunit